MRRVARAGHTPGERASHQNRSAVLRHSVFAHDETYEILMRGRVRKARKRIAADEIGFIELRDPRHSRLIRIRQRVGVHAHDHVPFLEPQQALCLHAERPDAELLSRFDQLVPKVFAEFTGEMNLPPGLAHETDAHEKRRHIRYHRFPARHVRKRFA